MKTDLGDHLCPVKRHHEIISVRNIPEFLHYINGNLHAHGLRFFPAHIFVILCDDLIRHVDPGNLIFHKQRIAVADKRHDPADDLCIYPALYVPDPLDIFIGVNRLGQEK